MTPVDLLAHLNQLREKATPGEWHAVINDLIGGVAIANRAVPCSQLDTRPESTDREIGDFMSAPDAALIVALVNALPVINAHVATLTAQVEELRGQLVKRTATAHGWKHNLDRAEAERDALTARLAAAENIANYYDGFADTDEEAIEYYRIWRAVSP